MGYRTLIVIVALFCYRIFNYPERVMIYVAEIKARGIIDWFRSTNDVSVIALAIRGWSSIAVWGDEIKFFEQVGSCREWVEDVRTLVKLVLGLSPDELFWLEHANSIAVVLIADETRDSVSIMISIDGIQLSPIKNIDTGKVCEWIRDLAECIIRCSYTNLPALFPNP